MSRFPELFSNNFAIFQFNVDEIVSEFCDTPQKMQRHIRICRKFAKSCGTFPQFSEVAEIIHLARVDDQFASFASCLRSAARASRGSRPGPATATATAAARPRSRGSYEVRG